MPVHIRYDGEVAVVTVDNPPVNAISREVRRSFVEAFKAIESNHRKLDRVILTGSGNYFSAGVDAREFDGALLEPNLPDVVEGIEKSHVPWIAAINGVALGGGAELVLACHARIAHPAIEIGFPEVKLGVIPSAGGTQRLPRLVGFEIAINLLISGRPMKAEAALECGLIDLIDENATDAAKTCQLDLWQNRKPLSQLPSPVFQETAWQKTLHYLSTRLRQQAAPGKAAELVALSTKTTFTDGIAEERKIFLNLRTSPQAKALRHLFFAERAAKAPKYFTQIEPCSVQTAVVVGGGTMGASIAYVLQRIGVSVQIIEVDDASAERARVNVAHLFDVAVARRLISADQARYGKEQIKVMVGYASLFAADLAIEAVFEDMGTKKAVFAALERSLPDTAILATNTSYLDVDEIASAVRDPSRVIGLHFFNPAHVMKLLEIIQARNTSDITISTGFSLAKKLGKIPVLIKACDGFIGNRILARYRETADILLVDGATPYEIDEAMVAFGYPMGPYEAQDLSGLDIAYANRRRQAATRDPNRRYISIADRMVERGRLGKKCSVGWYRYLDGQGKVEDPAVVDLVVEESHFAKVKRRPFSQNEIHERLITAMINEASDILEEGSAQSPKDIDLVTVHGYGFPRWRGGLMFHADQIGITKIVNTLQRLEQDDPIVWKPSAGLLRVIKAGTSFSEFYSN